MSKIILSYEEAKKLIKEGDVLLFQGTSFVSKMIKSLGRGKHSHVGIASWSGEILECIEFREWKGSRAVSLNQYSKIMKAGTIDVYRVCPTITKMVFDEKTKIIHKTQYKFNGRKVTNCMRRLTGLPYGWKRILYLSLRYLLLFRLFSREKDLDDDDRLIYPVCSTAVAHCFSKNFMDLVHNRSDNRTEPSDLSRSPVLNYLFTIG